MGIMTLVSFGITNSEPGTCQFCVHSLAVNAKHPNLWPSLTTCARSARSPIDWDQNYYLPGQDISCQWPRPERALPLAPCLQRVHQCHPGACSESPHSLWCSIGGHQTPKDISDVSSSLTVLNLRGGLVAISEELDTRLVHDLVSHLDVLRGHLYQTVEDVPVLEPGTPPLSHNVLTERWKELRETSVTLSNIRHSLRPLSQSIR